MLLTMGTHSAVSNFLRRHSNRAYEASNITRIDNFIIKLTRDHYARLSSINNASVAFAAVSATDAYIQSSMQSGFLPPEAFVYLDSHGYVQDADGIPVLYHIRRAHPKSGIFYQPNQNTATEDVIFDTSLPPCDVPDVRKLSDRYWSFHH